VCSRGEIVLHCKFKVRPSMCHKGWEVVGGLLRQCVRNLGIMTSGREAAHKAHTTHEEYEVCSFLLRPHICDSVKC
jgi:hypothetical protein